VNNRDWNLSYPDFRDMQATSPRALAGLAGVDQAPMHVVDDSRVFGLLVLTPRVS